MIPGQGTKIPHAMWHGQMFFLNKKCFNKNTISIVVKKDMKKLNNDLKH